MSASTKAIIESTDSFGSTLLVLLTDAYGVEALQWHPETIRLQLRDAFNAAIPKENEDKLQAAIAIVSTDFFFTNLPRFIAIVNGLNGYDAGDTIHVPDVDAVAWAVTESIVLYPPERTDRQVFSDEIRGFVSELLVEEGFSIAPDVLRLVVGNAFDPSDMAGFTDDPEMFAAISQSQHENVQAVQTFLQQQLTALMLQLQSLQLKNGNTDGFLKSLRNELKHEVTK